MQEEHMGNQTEHDMDDTAKWRKRRVKRIKSTIIVMVIILLILPTLICILLGIQVNRLQNRVEDLESIHRSEISRMQESQKENNMIAYAAERTVLEDKDNNNAAINQQTIEVNTTENDNLPSKEAQKVKEDKKEQETNIGKETNPASQYDDSTSEIKLADSSITSDNEAFDVEMITEQIIKNENTDVDTSTSDKPSMLPASDHNDRMEVDSMKDNTKESSSNNEMSPKSNDNQANSSNKANKTGPVTVDVNGIYSGKQVYLTFDDGPSIYTDEILDILNYYGVKATFFVIGATDKDSKRLYQRIVNEGHTLGMHSYSHKYKEIYNSVEDFDKDFTKLWNLLYDTTGYMPIIYRFPGGSSNLVNRHDKNAIIKYLNGKSILYYDWNVDNGDATGEVYTKEKLISNVLDGVALRNRSIVLMHDVRTKKTTVDSLSEILEVLISQGAEVLPLNEDVKPIQQIKADTAK